jgi:hypothetical protein
MEETFGGSDWNLSSNLNIDRIISFTCESWALNINNSYCLYVNFFLTFLNNIDKVFSFSWLTDHNNCLVFCYIFRLKINRIININLSKTFQMFKMPNSWHCSIITWSTCDHWQIVSKIYFIKFFKIRFKLKLSLPSNLIFKKSFIRWWWLF